MDMGLSSAFKILVEKIITYYALRIAINKYFIPVSSYRILILAGTSNRA